MMSKHERFHGLRDAASGVAPPVATFRRPSMKPVLSRADRRQVQPSIQDSAGWLMASSAAGRASRSYSTYTMTPILLDRVNGPVGAKTAVQSFKFQVQGKPLPPFVRSRLPTPESRPHGSGMTAKMAVLGRETRIQPRCAWHGHGIPPVGGANHPKSGTAPDRPDRRPRLARPIGAVPDCFWGRRRIPTAPVVYTIVHNWGWQNPLAGMQKVSSSDQKQ